MIWMFLRPRSFYRVFLIVLSLMILCLTALTIFYGTFLHDIRKILATCAINKLSIQELKENKFIHYVQRENKCCGIYYQVDWKDKQYPPSCCEGEPQDCKNPVPNVCYTHIQKLVFKFGSLIIAGRLRDYIPFSKKLFVSRS
ncbi:hypothetical protein RF11_06146 [Thelohanellus kitauei]|uniref:Uncharacterized protein n=1 Tax=Thelohanellus kitauei TaxID=669202 RepID=A0A0C2J6Z9_THEKT|nr:hypothetical protein RF11_06146 [Thelohanellus kitauei]